MNKPIARVHVNGVEVGSLPLDAYQAIVTDAKKDRRLQLALAAHFISGVFRTLLQGLRSAPWVVGALTGLLAVFDPGSFANLLGELKAADPTTITRFVSHTAQASFWMAAFGSVVIVLMKGKFRHPINEAISFKLRKALEVPAEGEVRVQVVEAPSTGG